MSVQEDQSNRTYFLYHSRSRRVVLELPLPFLYLRSAFPFGSFPCHCSPSEAEPESTKVEFPTQCHPEMQEEEGRLEAAGVQGQCLAGAG